ncbi:MAG TPA: ABC transporter ATP-binding protein, partial [Verrucomicrobiae bacterium]|nr:ABC transporter ATP-binding protein [Verrucomicrobiae bacterium]
VDNILGSKPTPPWLAALPESKAAALLVVCVALLVIHLVRGGLGAWSTIYLVRAGLRMTHELRLRVYEHLQKLSLVFHDQRAVGDSIYRVTWDTFSIQTLFNGGVMPLIASVVTLVSMIAIMLSFDVVLTLLAIIVAPALALVIKFYNRRMMAVSTEYHDRESKVSALIQESLASIRTVQAFAREEEEIRRFNIGASQSVDANLRMTRVQVISSFVVGMITAAGTVAMLWIGGQRVLAGRLTIGQLLWFLSYVGMLYGPMSTMSGLATAIQGALARFRRVVEILETKPAIRDAPNARPLERCDGVVRFDKVWFGYDSDRPVLKGIDFEARPGQMVALVGPSGVGKSTLLSLLLRFYDPQKGRVLVDGQDVREFQYRTLRQQISIVPQEPVLFSTTVADNIAYGRTSATREEIIDAAKQAEAHEFITAMTQGYDTPIGERGVLLSGGQRQRLALARAFLKNSPVLILDEPTAALDAEAEAAVLRALERLRKNRTVLVVAHRLSTVREATTLLVMHDGQIVERGTHAELIGKGGHYARVVQLQFGS